MGAKKPDQARVLELIAQSLLDNSQRVDAVDDRLFRIVEVLVGGVPFQQAARVGGGYVYRPIFDNAVTSALLAIVHNEPLETVDSTHREEHMITTPSPPIQSRRRPASARRPLSAKRISGQRHIPMSNVSFGSTWSTTSTR